MGNAIKYVKHEITHELRPNMTEDEAKSLLCDSIDRYINERIMLAHVRTFRSVGAADNLAGGDI